MADAIDVDLLKKAGSQTRRVAVYEGLPVKMVRALLSRDEFTIGDLARFIAPRRTLERRMKEGERLNREESDRLARFLPILDLCEYTFGGTGPAVRWLRKPLRTFNGIAPFDLMSTSAGAQEVHELLERGRHGMLA